MSDGFTDKLKKEFVVVNWDQRGTPKSVKVAHRTGTSFTNKEGMTGAVNDFGIIELSDKERIYIAVFVHDIYETFENAEAIIADIAKATYDYYHKK